MMQRMLIRRGVAIGLTATASLIGLASLASGQTSPRQTPKKVSATTSPNRDRHAPYRYRTRGVITLPKCPASGSGAYYCIPLPKADACNGRVSVKFKHVFTTLSSRTVRVNSQCKYTSSVTFSRKRVKKGSRLRVVVRFQGNASLKPRNARTQTVRAG